MRYAGWMNRAGDAPKTELQAGLCGNCSHARRVESERGSVFVMCKLSATDDRFPKYPRLPVFSCAGYSRREQPGSPKD
jgi:hypothetical protein